MRLTLPTLVYLAVSASLPDDLDCGKTTELPRRTQWRAQMRVVCLCLTTLVRDARCCCCRCPRLESLTPVFSPVKDGEGKGRREPRNLPRPQLKFCKGRDKHKEYGDNFQHPTADSDFIEAPTMARSDSSTRTPNAKCGRTRRSLTEILFQSPPECGLAAC